MNEQEQQLKRVFSSAAEAVKQFITERLADTETKGAFTADQLRNYVQNNITGRISPSSSDRVLRELRIKGVIDYLVLNRGKSLYRAVPLGTTHA